MNIPLTQGMNARVSREDYSFLMQWKWCAQKKKDNTYYAVRGVRLRGKSTLIRMHNVIAQRSGLEGSYIDHKDGNGLNNCRTNLRDATKSLNMANRGRTLANQSGYKGVSWHKHGHKWVAQIKANGRYYYLGLFGDKNSAARAYNDAAIKHFGEFARLNDVTA